MKSSPYFRRKGINFIGSMVLFISVFLMHSIFNKGDIYGIVDTKTVIWVAIYIIAGLSLSDYKGLSMMIERVWSLNCDDDNTMDYDAKLTLIKSYIEINIQHWNKYCKMFNSIVNGEKDQWTTWAKAKVILLKIPKGALSLKQFIWILLYLTFNIVQGQGYIPPITQGYEIIIDFGGLGFFMLTSSSVIGMGAFMEDIFKSIAPHSTRKAKESLTLLENNIIFGARWFGYLRNMVDIKCEDTKKASEECAVTK